MENPNLFKGILLVAGTSIGGGMLALPVMTGMAGFVPSLFIYILCWILMASTGLLLLEVSLWMEPGANIITMAERTLGKVGKSAAWILYLFLFYCLTLAYIVGCGDLVKSLFQNAIPEWIGSLIFIILFFPLVFVGARWIGPINAWLMLGLGISYAFFVILGTPYIETQNLKEYNWHLIPASLPIAFTAFAYQGVVPSLVTYMKRDVVALRKAIIIGSFLPFIVYAIWQALILGTVPIEGPHGLMETMKNGQTAIEPLKHFLSSPTVYLVGRYFAFFALVTSFLGVTLGLSDFLSDGLKIKKEGFGKLIICMMIFLPPMAIAFTNPGMFLIALDYAGGFGCALLLGLLPILMVWSGRYKLNFSENQLIKGGRLTLLLLMLFVIVEVFCQVIILRA